MWGAQPEQRGALPSRAWNVRNPGPSLHANRQRIPGRQSKEPKEQFFISRYLQGVLGVFGGPPAERQGLAAGPRKLAGHSPRHSHGHGHLYESIPYVPNRRFSNKCHL